MLRIHFTREDLLRTRIAPAANPFWEMVFSRLRLTESDPPVFMRSWSDQLRSRRARLRTGEQVLAALSPSGPYFPDFITPAEGLQGFDAGVEAILSTPRKRLRREMGMLAEWSPVPPWGRRLADGETATLTRLAAALRTYHATAIEPYSDLIQARIEAERAGRARDMREGGPEGLLNGLAPLMRWRAPVLEVRYPVDRDMHLQGRGLLLVPSFFCRHTPVALVDPELPPTLAYPIGPRSHWPATAHHSLAVLLGATRATVLAAIGDGATTTELARRAATSLPSVSRHTQVLRDAGLIETERRGGAVVHTLTSLGSALLAAPRETRERPPFHQGAKAGGR
ncbi:ArsR/SmtB family transcription factor [Nonomuraea sp. H19]|uniref:ArsR/SmtB family transcription factor n=1 Tax=Nonomuraea sp. H19 TaxID=3452206 RepID=UPI003F8BA818